MGAGWARNVLETCLRLRTGEDVLVLVDEPLHAAGDSLCTAAHEIGAWDATLRVLEVHRRPLAVVSDNLLKQVARADVIVSLLGELDLKQESAPLRAAAAAFRAAGRGRWAFGAFIDADVLDHELVADYREVARVAEGLARKLRGVSQVRLISPAGTDLTFSIRNRPVHVETGILTVPGDFGNLPAGEVFIAPDEASAQGTLVVDLSLGDLTLTKPVTLTFQGGRVVDIAGGAAARELKQRLGSDPWARTIGEFGLGANPWARICRRVTIDEKVVGTAHIGLGANQQFGGANPSYSHYDCVIRGPAVTLDGHPM